MAKPDLNYSRYENMWFTIDKFSWALNWIKYKKVRVLSYATTFKSNFILIGFLIRPNYLCSKLIIQGERGIRERQSFFSGFRGFMQIFPN